MSKNKERLRDKVSRKARVKALDATLGSTLHRIPRITKNWPHAKRRREGLEIHEDVRYGIASHRRLDVLKLEGGTGPALVYIHGGGFASCSKATHISIAVAFARRGYVVFNIDYRLAPQHPFPAAFEDAASALVWVAHEGRRYGADGRIVVAGDSAGANLALGTSLATAYGPDVAVGTADEPGTAAWRVVHEAGVTVSAASLACGVYQVSDTARLHRETGLPRVHRIVLQTMEDAYLPPGTRPGFMSDPVRLIEAHAPARPLPPVHILCGTADPLIADSVRLNDALRARDAQVSFSQYPDEPHAFHAAQKRPQAVLAWRDQDAFLERVLAPDAPDCQPL